MTRRRWLTRARARCRRPVETTNATRANCCKKCDAKHNNMRKKETQRYDRDRRQPRRDCRRRALQTRLQTARPAARDIASSSRSTRPCTSQISTSKTRCSRDASVDSSSPVCVRACACYVLYKIALSLSLSLSVSRTGGLMMKPKPSMLPWSWRLCNFLTSSRNSLRAHNSTNLR